MKKKTKSSQFLKQDRKRLQIYWHLITSFSTIGSVSFGGYLALIGMVREKFVLKDKLIGDNKITEAIALASLLPGPLAVNVVAYIGYGIAGIIGAIISIISVLFPSYLLLLTLSILYFEYNSQINFDAILMGIIPVIIAIILLMAVGMWKKNCARVSEQIIAGVSFFILFIFNTYWSIVVVIILSGMVGVFLFKTEKGKTESKIQVSGFLWYATVLLSIGIFYLGFYYYFYDAPNFELFHHFGSASLTLFGGGYVMIPVLNALLVDQLQWVTSNEFFLGISLGQITPGPILISAVFFGYKVNGIVGSLFASFGIFFPSSMLMILASKFYSQISMNAKIVSALQGIKPAIVGLILFSAFSMVYTSTAYSNIGYLILLILAAFLVLIKFKVSPVVAIIIGGFGGYLLHLFLG